MFAPTITLEMKGATMLQAEHCRAMIVKMFEAGVFNIRRGKAVLSFDHDGKLGSIEITEMRYRAGDVLTTKLESANIKPT